jgi:glutamate racemase
MIGVFDSGAGGLTVLTALRKELPSADFLYFGDIKNAPYGLRSHEELSRLTLEDIKLLLDRGATSIVSACNSASASLALSLFDAVSLTQQRMIEMVGPTVSAFKGYEGRIALTATVATINSGIYQSAFHMIGKEIQTFPIPLLAGAIEEGKSEAEIEAIIKDTFGPGPYEFDILVLSCTHYPLVIDTFKKMLPGVAIFNPAEVVAARAQKQFWPMEVANGKLNFVISSESEVFRNRVRDLFPDATYTIEVLS